MMDGNETIRGEPNGIIQLIQQTSLVDFFPLHHSKACDISTYARTPTNTRRIDYILETSKLVTHVKQCGYLEFYNGIMSDHRGLFVDFDNHLFYTENAPLLQQPRVITTTTHYKHRIAYKQYIHKQFTQHNIYGQSTALLKQSKQVIQDPKQFMKLLNKLD